MPIMSWSDSYTVNTPVIDTQHKKLFTLVNNLHDAMLAGKGKDVLGQTLDALIDYTRVHFADEEKMLAKIKYPDLAIQQKEHEAFTRKVLELQADFRAGKAALTMPALEFLKDWLVNHIMKNDKKYAPFIK